MIPSGVTHAPPVQVHYRWVLVILRDDQSFVAQAPIEPDWEPALEDARFTGVRRGVLRADTSVPQGQVVPIWHTTLGPPYVSGIRVVVSGDTERGGEHVARDIPLEYFRKNARDLSATLVASGQLKANELFRFRACAFGLRSERNGGAGESDGPSCEEVVRPLPVRNATLAGCLKAAVPAGGEHVEGDVPVFLPHQVVEEARSLAVRAGDFETGGILVGHLCRDSSVSEVFVQVTAQIPAQHSISAETRFTFTPDTWAAATAAIELRRRGELMVGWYHSHPPSLCRRCPPEKRDRCVLSGGGFFSADDVHLHRVCFGRAYHVALLIYHDDSSPTLGAALFGWRRGMVAVRGYHLLGADRAADDVTAAATASSQSNQSQQNHSDENH